MSLCYTKRRPNHNLTNTLEYTYSYRTKKFICTCSHSSVHAQGTKFRGGNCKHFDTSIGRNRRSTTTSQGRIRNLGLKLKDRGVSLNTHIRGTYHLQCDRGFTEILIYDTNTTICVYVCLCVFSMVTDPPCLLINME